MSDAAAPESPSRLQARLTLQLLQAGVPNIDVLRASSVEELHALADEHGVAVDGQNPSRGAGSALSLLLGGARVCVRIEPFRRLTHNVGRRVCRGAEV